MYEREQEREVADFLQPGFWVEGFLSHRIEDDDGHRGEEEDGSLNEQVAPLAEIGTPLTVGEDEEAKSDQKEIREVCSEVRGCFKLDGEREFAFPDGREALLAALDGTLGPAMLLVLKSGHIDRKLSGGFRLP